MTSFSVFIHFDVFAWLSSFTQSITSATLVLFICSLWIRMFYFLFPAFVLTTRTGSSTGARGETCLFSNCNSSNVVKLAERIFTDFSWLSSVRNKTKETHKREIVIWKFWQNNFTVNFGNEIENNCWFTSITHNIGFQNALWICVCHTWYWHVKQKLSAKKNTHNIRKYNNFRCASCFFSILDRQTRLLFDLVNY